MWPGGLKPFYLGPHEPLMILRARQPGTLVMAPSTRLLSKLPWNQVFRAQVGLGAQSLLVCRTPCLDTVRRQCGDCLNPIPQVQEPRDQGSLFRLASSE